MQKKSRGEHPASLFVTLFILVTIGSYSYIVVPLCHCLCKTSSIPVSIYNIQSTTNKY
jgi:cytochrome c oxidase assembly protein Cox11